MYIRLTLTVYLIFSLHLTVESFIHTSLIGNYKRSCSSLNENSFHKDQFVSVNRNQVIAIVAGIGLFFSPEQSFAAPNIDTKDVIVEKKELKDTLKEYKEKISTEKPVVTSASVSTSTLDEEARLIQKVKSFKKTTALETKSTPVPEVKKPAFVPPKAAEVVAPVPKPLPVAPKSIAPVVKLLPEEVTLNKAISLKNEIIAKQNRLSSEIKTTKASASTLESAINALEKDISKQKALLQRKNLDKVVGQKAVDEIVRLEKEQNKFDKQLQETNQKVKKLNSDLDNASKQLPKSDAEVRQKTADLKKKIAEKAAADAVAKAQAKAKALAKAEAEVAASKALLRKSEQEAKVMSEKLSASSKVIGDEESQKKKAVEELKARMELVEKARSKVAAEENDVRIATEKTAAVKAQLDKAAEKVKANKAAVIAAEKTIVSIVKGSN